MDRKKKTTVSTFRTAGMVQEEYVTCREGDVRRLPFTDNYFNVVVSAVFLHMVGKEFGEKTAVAAERMMGLGEVVRVLMPGGAGWPGGVGWCGTWCLGDAKRGFIWVGDERWFSAEERRRMVAVQ